MSDAVYAPHAEEKPGQTPAAPGREEEEDGQERKEGKEGYGWGV